MSYQKVAIDASTAVPSNPVGEMRPDMVIDPYRSKNTIAKVAETSGIQGGQQGINSSPKVSTESLGTEETASKPAVSTEELPVTLSAGAAALARKEQRARQRELEIKKREEALAAERAEIEELKSLKAKLLAKDYSGIESLVKYDDYTQYLIEKDQGKDPILEEVKSLKSDLEAEKKAREAEVERRFEAEVNNRRQVIKSLAETDPRFSKIKKAKAEDAVLQHILQTWEHDSIDLSPEDAAKEVEALLTERAQKWKALLEEEKVVSGSAETPKASQVDEKKQLPPLKPAIKTLTNNMTISGEVKRISKSFSQMSEQERYAEARRRAEEKLKTQGRI